MPITPIRPTMDRHDDRPRTVRPPDALRARRPLLQHGVRLLERELHRWPLFTKTASRTMARRTSSSTSTGSGGIGGPIWISPAFENVIVDETETTRIMMNGDGLIAEVPKDDHDTIPHFIRATVVTPDDWKGAKRSASAATIRRAQSMWRRSRRTPRQIATTRWACTAAR